MITTNGIIGVIVWLVVLEFVGAFIMIMLRGHIWRAQAVKATKAPERSITVQLTVGLMGLMWPYRAVMALRRAQRAAMAKRGSDSE